VVLVVEEEFFNHYWMGCGAKCGGGGAEQCRCPRVTLVRSYQCSQPGSRICNGHYSYRVFIPTVGQVVFAAAAAQCKYDFRLQHRSVLPYRQGEEEEEELYWEGRRRRRREYIEDLKKRRRREV